MSERECNEVYYTDVRYAENPAPVLKRLARYHTFKDLILTSFNESSYAIGFGEEDNNVIVPRLFSQMKLFNIGVLEVKEDANLDLVMLEELIMDYLVIQSKSYTNPLIGIYEGSSFSSLELEEYVEQDMKDNFGVLDKKNDFITVVENEEGRKKIICHSLGTKLIEKCINTYSRLAESYISKQKTTRLDVLNSSTEDLFLRKTISQELEHFTVEKGFEFLPRHLIADFKRDLQKCVVINYMSTMSILLLINDTFKLSEEVPKMHNQISDHFTYNTLHINFRLLLPEEKSMVFNPSTFEFSLLKNISDRELPLPLYFKSEGEGVEKEKDKKIWIDFNNRNSLYFSEDYNEDLLAQIKAEDYEVMEKLKPIFVYAN